MVPATPRAININAQNFESLRSSSVGSGKVFIMLEIRNPKRGSIALVTIAARVPRTNSGISGLLR